MAKDLYAVSGVDFDDADYGVKQEDKPKVKVCYASQLHIPYSPFLIIVGAK